MSNLALFYLALTVLLTSVSQLLQKKAAMDVSIPGEHKPLLSNVSFVVSGILLGISLITWLQVLNTIEVSIAYPMLSLNYIVVLILANVFLGEAVPSHRWIGVICIFTGVTVLASGHLR